jgi:hypothetical protein
MKTVNLIPSTTGSKYANLGTAVWVKTTAGKVYKYLNGTKVSTAEFNEAIKNLKLSEAFKFGQESCPSGKIKIYN